LYANSTSLRRWRFKRNLYSRFFRCHVRF
jgi:hypothetical protein